MRGRLTDEEEVEEEEEEEAEGAEPGEEEGKTLLDRERQIYHEPAVQVVVFMYNKTRNDPIE